MVKAKNHSTLKGNPYWAISYALSSLRNYPLRNAGIALVLAIGIALPTTIFVWTNTGATIAVEDYFAQSTYQMTIVPNSGQTYSSSNMEAAIAATESSPLVDYVHMIPSTVGILAGDSIPNWTTYSIDGLNYREGIKDMRIIVVDNNILGNWTTELDITGNHSLATKQVLVSTMFVEYTRQVHNITIKIGDMIDFDFLRSTGRAGPASSPDDLGAIRYSNFTVAGIFSIAPGRTLLSKSFVSISRKNWDPMSLYNEPVLGIADSIIVLRSDLDEYAVDDIIIGGFFNPVAFVRGSTSGLIDAGISNIGSNLESLINQLSTTYPGVSFTGFSEIWKLQSTISTYLQSQIVTLIALPVLIMSLMLTVFTSETSISRRKGEISALRSKGASFNQVFSTFMWESIILSVIGFLSAMVLTMVMAPLIGSATGLFQFDSVLYTRFLTELSFPPLAVIIAGFISMYLPAAYILHVARRIDVSEVGQPTVNMPDEGAEESNFLRNLVGLILILSLLLALPVMIKPLGPVAIGELIGATLLLFVAAYLGSIVMRAITARLSGGTNFLLGEKALYLSRSLRKRKGQFVPLLVILTLTLTTTNMMLIQSSSYTATLENEIGYSIGADIRVECDSLPVNFTDNLLKQRYVYGATPVIETFGEIGSNKFFIEGVDAKEYAKIGYFSDESFVSDDPSTVLTRLSETPNGIIISEYYSYLWNLTVGDELIVKVATATYYTNVNFTIIGLMRSAPGFGMASTHDISGVSVGAQLGFQVVGEGFALVNLDILMNEVLLTEASLFLVDTVSYANMTEVIESIGSLAKVTVYSPLTFDIATQAYSLFLFKSAIDGLTMISFMLCLLMGLSSIALFLGSAVLDRKAEYAIFRALGGTKRQVVSMVFGEFAGTVIASIAISILLGFVFGYSNSILTFGISPFSPILAGVLAFPLLMMLVVILSESVVMICSCYIPARRAASVDPAVVLRNL